MVNPQKPEDRQRILDGARRHFFTHGFRGVTMDDLAGELGMSKKTLYRHFPSKQEILETLLERKLSEADADLEAVVADRRLRFAERLRGMLDCVKRQTDELSPAFLRDMGKDAPGIFAVVHKRRGILIRKHWGALMEEGRQQGMLRREFSVGMLLAMLVGATDAVVNPIKLGELGLAPQEAYTAIVRIFFEGIATAKGKRTL